MLSQDGGEKLHIILNVIGIRLSLQYHLRWKSVKTKNVYVQNEVKRTGRWYRKVY